MTDEILKDKEILYQRLYTTFKIGIFVFMACGIFIGRSTCNVAIFVAGICLSLASMVCMCISETRLEDARDKLYNRKRY